jgi:hypothetical protein
LRNVPAFLSAVEESREKGSKVYVIDENFVNSINALISNENKNPDLKKQWLGFLLVAKTFDPKVSCIDEAVFGKSINILLNSISNAINKHDIFADISVVAIRAF